MKHDAISLLYLGNTLITEMAMDIGFESFSRIKSNPEYRKALFQSYKNHDIVHSVSPTVSVHMRKHSDVTEYATLDHQKQELVHFSQIQQNPSTDAIPFAHDTQKLVDRTPSTESIPRWFATKMTYNHFLNSDVPLRSSETQYHKGHQMWGNLVKMALDDGHYAYHFNEDTKKLTRLDHNNMESSVRGSFGKSDEYERQHLIISKTKLSVDTPSE
jgi:hypothetical protein